MMSEMSDISELDRLIISNLADLDATVSRIDALGAMIWREIGEYTAEWARGIGWHVEADDNDVYVTPSAWTINESAPRYYFGWGPGDNDTGGPDEPTSWLARMVGVSQGQLCLWLDHRAGLRAWKPLANAARESLSPIGFHLSDAGDFYADCTIDAGTLAGALTNGRIADAFGPIEVALNGAAAATPLFSPLLKKAGQL